MEGLQVWSVVSPEFWLRVYVHLSPRDEGRLGTVNVLHYQLRSMLVNLAWEPHHPLHCYVFAS